MIDFKALCFVKVAIQLFRLLLAFCKVRNYITLTSQINVYL